MKNRITVTIVEDHLDYRKGIEIALKPNKQIELISQFATAERALRSLQDRSTRKVPDVLLLDLNLPGISGIEALPWFKKAAPDTEIIVLTQSDSEADILAAIAEGASGYLLKSASLNTLQDGIRTVAEGGSILDTGVARFLLQTLKRQPEETAEENTLTERELEILLLISEGLAKKEVADRLSISTKTVANHAAHIYEKLNVPNAPAAVDKAHRLGLFSKKRNT